MTGSAPRLRTLALALGCALLCAPTGGCGDTAPGSHASGPCRVQDAAAYGQSVTVPRPLEGVYFAQEIWLSYHSKEHEGQGYRFQRTREDALALARKLCREVHAGADIGALARKHSNAPGGRAYGFAAAPEPSQRSAPDARDAALFLTPVGQLTPLLEWRGGFWFARRIGDARGRELAAVLEKESRRRARARMIHIHHAKAWPTQFEYEDVSPQQALLAARSLIERLQAGESFAALALEYSNDADTASRGGLLWTTDPKTGKRTEWLRWGDTRYPDKLLEVILYACPVGEVWAEPVVHGRGIDVVQVLERIE